MRPCGGIIGLVPSFEGGNENQKQTTPHFHGQAHVVCVYQFGSLADVAKRLQDGLIKTQAMKDFQDWFHVEKPLSPKLHASYEKKAADEFWDRHRSAEHTPLSVVPGFLDEDAQEQKKIS